MKSQYEQSFNYYDEMIVLSEKQVNQPILRGFYSLENATMEGERKLTLTSRVKVLDDVGISGYTWCVCLRAIALSFFK